MTLLAPENKVKETVGAEDQVEACRVILHGIIVGPGVWLVSLPTTR